MILTPLTNTQIPDKSLLDINGRQTYLGNSFILPLNGKSLSDTSEHPILLIENPGSSDKSLFLFSRKVSSDNNNILMRFYSGPTITSAGTPTTALNLRSGSQNTSIAQCYLSPTIASNGAFLANLPATVYSITSDVLFILDPGTTFLITGQQFSGSSGSSNAFSENIWYEI